MEGYSRRQLACMTTKEIKEKYVTEVRLPLHLRREGNDLSVLKNALESRGINVPSGTNPRSLL